MKAAAIIVCYNPDPDTLRSTCDAARRSGCDVILVDNTEASALQASGRFTDCAIVANGDNLGIAAAQNIGIARARQLGARAVVFFDQDSVIDDAFLPTLLRELSPGVADVVAPVSIDAARGFEYPALRVNRFGAQTKLFSAGHDRPYDADVVLSSGTAATVETFDRAGLMDEAMFIDAVDTEWSLRCRQAGVRIRVVPRAVMRHSVGHRSIRLGVATVLVHSPVRCYYQMRNAVRMFGRPGVPFLFALREALVTSVHKALLIVAVPNRRTYLRACAQGVFDGLRGVTGRKSLPSSTRNPTT